MLCSLRKILKLKVNKESSHDDSFLLNLQIMIKNDIMSKMYTHTGKFTKARMISYGYARTL
ncbi:hypothetical protein SKB0068_11910 [Staphylococcus hominis subsp. novobiosepticus]